MLWIFLLWFRYPVNRREMIRNISERDKKSRTERTLNLVLLHFYCCSESIRGGRRRRKREGTNESLCWREDLLRKKPFWKRGGARERGRRKRRLPLFRRERRPSVTERERTRSLCLLLFRARRRRDRVVLPRGERGERERAMCLFLLVAGRRGLRDLLGRRASGL